MPVSCRIVQAPCHRSRVRRLGRAFGPLLLLLSEISCGGGRASQLTTEVEDWRDEVIYQIVVDRFDNGSLDNDNVDGVGVVAGDLARFQGGDWAGISRRLGYLQRLGVTALWISPVVANVQRTSTQDGFHGYWAADFTRENPRFGSLEELQQLVAAAHQRGIKIIADVVVNHTGRLFFYDLNDNGQQDPGEVEPPFRAEGPYAAPLVWLEDRPQVFRYADRMVAGSIPQRVALAAQHFHRRGQTTNYLSTEEMWEGDFPTGLRDLNTEQETVVEGMIDSCLRWVELTNVDGLRLDAVPHAPHAFWQRFAGELRRALALRGKGRFLLLGEVYHHDPSRLASYVADGGLDTVFDFPFKWQVIDGYLLDGQPASTTRDALEVNRGLFPALPHRGGIELAPWQARVLLADNHDLPRIRRELDDPYAAELAMTLVFTVDGIPSIYYGTEQELAGGWGDAAREPLWLAGFREHTRMYRHLQLLARLRREEPALRRGALQIRFASTIDARRSGPGAGLLVFERAFGERRVLVAVNAHPQDAAEAEFETGFAPGTQLTNRLLPPWEAEPAVERWTVSKEGRVRVRVAPRRALLLGPL